MVGSIIGTEHHDDSSSCASIKEQNVRHQSAKKRLLEDGKEERVRVRRAPVMLKVHGHAIRAAIRIRIRRLHHCLGANDLTGPSLMSPFFTCLFS